MAARVARFTTQSAIRMRSSGAPELYAPIFTQNEPRIGPAYTTQPREVNLAMFNFPIPDKPDPIPPKFLKPHGSTTIPSILPFIKPDYDPILISPKLSFSLEEAKKYLINVDRRFAAIFAKLPCHLYEHLEPVDPFQFLVNSLLGWPGGYFKPHRHRFLRIFNPSLPKGVPPLHENALKCVFPSPIQVANTSAIVFQNVGIEAERTKNMLDLATRFIDGRLSTYKLVDASDSLLARTRGIGPLTADRFAMFALRHPNVLPSGDLGLQRGLIHWILSSYDPELYPLRLDPKKLPEIDDFNGSMAKQPSKIDISKQFNDKIILPTALAPIPLPKEITLEELRLRAYGKVVKGGGYLSLKEMEALTKPWVPYLSLGMYYMWSVVGLK